MIPLLYQLSYSAKAGEMRRPEIKGIQWAFQGARIFQERYPAASPHRRVRRLISPRGARWGEIAGEAAGAGEADQREMAERRHGAPFDDAHAAMPRRPARE